MQPLLRVVPPLVAPLVAIALLLAACGQPRSVAEQGPICRSMATLGQLPVPYPDITPNVQAEYAREATRYFAGARGVAAVPEPPAQALPGIGAQAFRAKIAAQAAARRSVSATGAAQPTSILSVSAGGTWGAFSIGFLDGWGQNPAEPRPRFHVVTGVSTGASIAVAIFLGDPALIANVRELYANLREGDLYTQRPWLTLLSSTSLFNSAPLRRKLDTLLTDSMVEALAAENGQRTLAVLATNLDSGVPEVFDLTAIAATPDWTAAQKHAAIVAALMASSAEPVVFPPEFIGGNLYADGGVRVHAFFANELQVALAEQGQPIDLTVVVSGDMAVTRDCTGLNGLGLIAMVGRTASVALDQLLRNSVTALMAVGLKPGNQARMVNAARLINYYGDINPPPPELCKISEKTFDTDFERCLADKGGDMGRAQPIVWNIAVAGATRGRPPRISAVR